MCFRKNMRTSRRSCRIEWRCSMNFCSPRGMTSFSMKRPSYIRCNYRLSTTASSSSSSVPRITRKTSSSLRRSSTWLAKSWSPSSRGRTISYWKRSSIGCLGVTNITSSRNDTKTTRSWGNGLSWRTTLEDPQPKSICPSYCHRQSRKAKPWRRQSKWGRNRKRKGEQYRRTTLRWRIWTCGHPSCQHTCLRTGCVWWHFPNRGSWRCIPVRTGEPTRQPIKKSRVYKRLVTLVDELELIRLEVY